MIVGATDQLSDDELMFGYLPEYLDGELPKSVQERFNKLMLKPEYKTAVENFQMLRGKLQLETGKIHASGQQMSALRGLVQDNHMRETLEASNIAQLEKKEFMSDVLRRVGMMLGVLVLIGAAFYMFVPQNKAKFDALEYITYEALALEEDPDGRLDLPSEELREIKQYVEAIPGLNFKPQVLKDLGDDWKPEGASLIDYEIAKVVVVRYSNPDRGNEKLHHFSFSGAFSDLPKAERAEYRGLSYQVYANDRLNVLAWESSPGVMSFLVGRRSAVELAELARRGSL